MPIDLDYAVIFNATSNGMVFSEYGSGRIVDVNEALIRATGIPRDAALGKTAVELGIWPDQAKRDSCLTELEKTGRVVDFEALLIIKSMERPHLISARFVDMSGTRHVLWEIRDITERKQAEDQLRKLSLAVEQSPAGILITNLQGNIEYVNQTFVRTTGYSRQEVLGRNPRMLQSGKTPQKTFAAMWGTLKQGHTWQGEVLNRRKDGTEYTEWAIITPIFQPDGRITHYVAVQEDITERKRNSEELGRYRLHLEELVESRTHELELAKAAAEKANHAKSTFLANMSHEIRTPMNAIIGLTYVLGRKIKVPEQTDQLSKIAAAADHLLGVINDILDISKIEASKLVLERSDFDLESLLTRITSMVIDRIRDKGLELTVDIEPGLGLVCGDETRLGQALLNYLGNAVKFTERGTIIVRARRLETTDDDILVRFEVEDTGTGIAAEHLPRLFQAFEQADSSTTRQFGGTGLGLAITRRLAKLMEGEAGVTSTPGVGSTFWITARLGRTRTRSDNPQIAALAGLRALVIDDTPVTLLVQSRLLGVVGLASEGAASGAAAIEAILAADRQGKPFRLISVDLHMPGMDGFETLANLRSLPLRHQPMAWLVTASGDPEIIEDAHKVGFAEVVLKPLSATLLHDSLARHQAALLEQRAEVPTVATAPDLETKVALRRDHRGARLLLVEDDPINQEVALIMLSEIGWSVDVADNGQQAVARVASGAYQLILMDMQMPVMDGIEATRAIRQLPNGKTVPILAMTANAFAEDKARCLAAGMNDFLAKPVRPSNLFEMLLRWLRHQAPAPTTDDPGEDLPPNNDRAEPSTTGLRLEAIEGLEGLEGLDIDHALEVTRGDLRAYQKLLGKFIGRSRAELDQMHQLLASHDAEGARKIAHRIKGAAGVLGITRLQTLATELDAHLRASHADAEAIRRATKLDAEFNALAGAVATLANQPNPT